MVIDAFLACLFNVHYLIFLSMVHEYAYFLWIYFEIGTSLLFFCASFCRTFNFRLKKQSSCRWLADGCTLIGAITRANCASLSPQSRSSLTMDRLSVVRSSRHTIVVIGVIRPSREKGRGEKSQGSNDFGRAKCHRREKFPQIFQNVKRILFSQLCLPLLLS